MKNVLLIGDLRTAFNYGAVATSEALIDLIDTKVDKQHLRMIEFRSFYAETPIEGWAPLSVETKPLKQAIKKLLIVIGLYRPIRYFLDKTKKININCHVPYHFFEYKSFSAEVTSGKKLPYEKAALEWADIIIINSEGNIVNGTDKKGIYRFGGLYVLFMAYLAKCVFKKQCYIINHTVDPMNRDAEEIIKNLYPKMDGIYVREHMTEALLHRWGVKNHMYVPDALFSHNFEKKYNEDVLNTWKGEIDFSKPYICLGDSSGIKNKYNQVKWDIVKVYRELILQLKNEICPQILFIDGYAGGNEEINKIIKENKLVSVNIQTCDYHTLYFMLKNAQIFISGRWHASIISLKAHTPILLFGSDSHKTEALYKEIDWPFFFFDAKTIPINIDRICKEAKRVLAYDCSEVWKRVDELTELAAHNTDML